MEIAQKKKKIVEKNYPNKQALEIKTTPSDDKRSYHINSDKIAKKLGFIPQYSISDAVNGICDAFEKNLLPLSLENEIYFNVKTMKKIKAI